MPAWVFTDTEKLNRASRYFGLVGTFVGIITATVFWLAQTVLPIGVAVVLSMIVSVLLTGGFHEDGLADTADGLGGGWKVADKLNIMKDSRLGSYGALALVLVLLLKWQSLTELALYDPITVVAALIAAHTLSRVVAASFIFTETYVRDDETSKSKPLASEQNVNDISILLLCSLPVALLVHHQVFVYLVVTMLVARFVLVRIFRRQIGGYTGDVLGAVQQVCELICYLVILLAGGLN
ncbi:adenosylcobinamide-GDP ribazoletransferase [Shewanella marina]|uniref:adenosylcobinamide-GDP ribazoletransferase n=1 Tax=Shewanella marina TaxID=487319 RepID=UPI003570A003